MEHAYPFLEYGLFSQTRVSFPFSFTVAVLGGGPHLPIDMPPKNGRTVTVEHDLSMGSLSVDLSTHGHLPEHSSTGSSSDTTVSGDEDYPDDENDGFLEFFSNRYHKRFKTKVRARGPSIL